MNSKLLMVVATAAFCAAQSVFAADLPQRVPAYNAPAVVRAPMFSWTGCYVGLNAGGGYGKSDYTTNVDFPLGGAGFDAGSHNVTGALAGGQLGCNYQAGSVVFGLEGMFDWTNLKGDHVPLLGAVTLSTKAAWIATATGRIGYAFDRSLVYVKGGGAWIDVKESITGVAVDDGGRVRTGWTLGLGWESAFAANWSVKLEYNYLDFGTKATRGCALGVCAPTGLDHDLNVHAVLVGVNYRF